MVSSEPNIVQVVSSWIFTSHQQHMVNLGRNTVKEHQNYSPPPSPPPPKATKIPVKLKQSASIK